MTPEREAQMRERLPRWLAEDEHVCPEMLREVFEALDAERARVAAMEKAVSNSFCAYCGVDLMDATFDDLREHIEVCPSHPLAAERAKVRVLREALESLRLLKDNPAAWLVADKALAALEQTP